MVLDAQDDVAFITVARTLSAGFGTLITRRFGLVALDVGVSLPVVSLPKDRGRQRVREWSYLDAPLAAHPAAFGRFPEIDHGDWDPYIDKILGMWSVGNRNNDEELCYTKHERGRVGR